MFERRFPMQGFAKRLSALGCVDVLVKHLAPNDNGKNQIYLAGDISSLGLLPTADVEFNAGTSQKPGAAKRGPIFRAAMNLWWISGDGELNRAPHAKLIVYPQYSEVRLSGFVLGCRQAPSELFDITKRGRDPGRVLVLAPLPDGRVLAAAFEPESEEANALRSCRGEPYGVLQRFDLTQSLSSTTSQDLLLGELRRIHCLGWLAPVYLQGDGSFKPCKGSNCGGVTLESYLGIRANGNAEPDFHGWEIKQHGVTSLVRPTAARITLMTPEPSGGAYVEHGPRFFVREWGYPDQHNKPDRINFGGIYRMGSEAHQRTRLRLELQGYDLETNSFKGDGAVVLVDQVGKVAAAWSFAKLMDHWKRKHAKAAYVPSEIQKQPDVRYRYGHRIALAEGGKFKLLLRAFATGVVYYDPGIKLEGADPATAPLKRRSQFRVDSRSLAALYDSYREVDLLDE